jgi:hypothetical protein
MLRVSIVGATRCLRHADHACRALSSSSESGRGNSLSDAKWNPLKMNWSKLPGEEEGDVAAILRLANMINAFR